MKFGFLILSSQLFQLFSTQSTPADCPNFFNNSCYEVSLTPTKFIDAQATCEQDGGNLASIHSDQENQYVVSLFKTTGFTSLGGIAPSKNSILWNDNSIQDYNNIKTFVTGNCLYMNVGDDGDSQWYSDLCSQASWFVCKRPIGQDSEL